MNPLPRPRAIWRSITWRIQLCYAVALALAISGMMVAFQKSERAHRIDVIDNQLARLLRPLLPEIDPLRRHGPGAARGRPGMPPPHRRQGPPGARGHPPGGGPPREETGGALPAPQRDHIEVEPWIRDRHWAIAWDRFGEEIHRSGAEPPAEVRFRRGPILQELETVHGQRSMTVRGPSRSLLRVGVPLDALEVALARHARQLAALGGAYFLGGLLAGWAIVRWGLRPIREIGHRATEIAHGDLSRRIDVEHAATELRELATVLNEAFQRLEADIQRRERFTADASHELRTPLTVVLGQIQQLLARERPEQEFREGLASAERAARRMKKLVDELMVLARLDAAGSPRLDAVDLADIAREVASEQRTLLAKRDAELVLDLEPAPLAGDHDALLRTLTNLVGNAIQHNPVGTRIHLSTRRLGDQVRVVVVDNGHGIPHDHQQRLFERFYRADAARSRRAGNGNSGLGLAICKAIVEQHHGSIRVESEPGAGCRFEILLPARQPAAALV